MKNQHRRSGLALQRLEPIDNLAHILSGVLISTDGNAGQRVDDDQARIGQHRLPQRRTGSGIGRCTGRGILRGGILRGGGIGPARHRRRIQDCSP